MARNLELLLTENVEGTGIVGDVVKVRKGFARNFLLPRGYATTPSEEKLASLASKRAEAQKMLADLRKSREELIARLSGFELSMIRSCNDLGILYGAVTQHEIAEALAAAGFKGIKDREVRLGQVIKRVDDYDLHIKFDTDLDATIKLHIKPDRELDLRRGHEEAAAAPAGAAGAPGEEGAEGEALAKRPKDRSARGEKGAAPDKEEKGEKVEKATGWGKPSSKPDLHATKGEHKGEKKSGEAKGEKKGEKKK